MLNRVQGLYKLTLPLTACESFSCSISLLILGTIYLFHFECLNLTVVLICTFLIANRVKHFLKSLLAIWRSSFMNYLLKALA